MVGGPRKIKKEMDSKPLLLFCFCLTCNVFLHVAYAGVSHPLFRELPPLPASREQRYPPGPTKESRVRANLGGVGDRGPLTALKTRLSPMRALGVGLLDAAIRAYRVLWPNTDTPASVDELSRCLQGREKRLREWRASAARVGADEAMIYVLSWYEGINLDALQSMRAGSKWTTDPELVKRRQERAYSFIRYARIHEFVEGPVHSDDEEEEEVSEDEEEVDEELEADMPPGAAAGTAA